MIRLIHLLNESVKVNCKGCNHSWDLSDGGKEPYLCHKCGTNNHPLEEREISDLEKRIKKISKAAELKKENERIPRKKGQHTQSSSHSDLYTDENPKGTIHGLKFATVKDAKASVAKIKSSGKSHAHKIQAAVAMEQRARVMGKSTAAGVYRTYINSIKKS